MTFIWPAMLALLAAVPLGAALYALQQRRRRRIVAAYGDFGLAQGSGRPIGWRRHLPPALFLAGLAVLIVALARPQAVVSLPRLEGTVILAFDVSGSMAADDMKPTRMEAAKAAARSFAERQPSSILIGVVAFSDAGLAVQPPTDDQAEVLAAIDRLGPQRGTSLANGIYASLNTIAAAGAKEPPSLYTNLTPEPTPSPTPMPQGTFAPAAIVLLTDGENNQSPDPLAAAQAAAERGVRIHTVGVGSAAGTLIKVEGFTVRTRLDEPMLQQLSELAGGAYYAAEDEQDLRAIYDNLDLQLAIKPERTELTSLFAGASILFFVIGGVLSLAWLGRLP